MEHLVAVIQSVPLFAELPRDAQARLLNDLEEIHKAPGQFIIKQGDIGDALYVVVSGLVEVQEEGGRHVEQVAVFGPGDWFGEMALLTGEARSASVIALSSCQLLRLDKPRFDSLCQRHPSVLQAVARGLCHRLAYTSDSVVWARGAYREVFDTVLVSCTDEERRALFRVALAGDDPRIADQLSGKNRQAETLLARLAERYPALVARDGAVRYALHARFHAYLEERMEAEEGPLAMTAARGEIAQLLIERGEIRQALGHWLEAGRWHDAAQAIWRLMATPAAPSDEELGAWLDRFPEPALIETDLVGLKASLLSKRGNAEGAAALLGRAAQLDIRARPPQVALQEALAARYRAAGRWETAYTWTRSARALSRGLPSGATGPQPRRELMPQWATWLLAVVLAGLVAWHTRDTLPVVTGRFLAVLVAAVVLWTRGRPPDYVVGLAMGMAWVLLGVASPRVAFGGFASSAWLLMVGVLGLAAALARSGLLYRITLLVLRGSRPTFAGQTVALGLAGVVSTLLIPSAQARVTLMGPIVSGLAENLRYPPRSPGSTGLALAVFAGFSLTTTMFLTGTPTCLIAWRMLPEATRAEITWITWLIGVLPLELVTLGGALTWIAWHYRPADAASIDRRRLTAQLNVLGPPTRQEYVSALVASALLIAWIAQPLHGIDPAWLALAALCIVIACGILDRAAVQGQVDWPFLLFMGMAFSLADLAVAVRADAWLGQATTWAFGTMGSASVVVGVAIVVTLAIRTVMPWQTAVPLLTVSLAGVAEAAGVSPWIAALVALKAGSVFFLPYQNTYYLTLYYGTEGKVFTHRGAAPFAWVYAALVVVGFFISLPYWRLLGLIR